MAINTTPPADCPPIALYLEGTPRVEHVLDTYDTPIPQSAVTHALDAHPGEELVLTIMRRYDPKTGASEGTEWIFGTHDRTKVASGKGWRLGVPNRGLTYTTTPDPYCGIEKTPGAMTLPAIDQQQNDAIAQLRQETAPYGPQLKQLQETVKNHGARISALEQASKAYDAGVSKNAQGITGLGADYANLESQVQQQSTGIDATAAGVSKNAQGIAGLGARESALELRVNEHGDTLSAYGVSIDRLTRDVNGITSKQTTMSASISKLDARMANVENAIYPWNDQKARMSDRIDTNQAMINGVNGRVDTLETEMASRFKDLYTAVAAYAATLLFVSAATWWAFSSQSSDERS